jgi:hypothetical protein
MAPGGSGTSRNRGTLDDAPTYQPRVIETGLNALLGVSPAIGLEGA